MTPKRILVTGAGGAIGAHALDLFLDSTDWDIVCLDSFRHKGYYDRITTIMDKHPEDAKKRVTVITHDLVAPITMREFERIGHIDYVLNLASLSDVQDSIDNPVPFVRNNVDLVLNMLEYARVARPAAFIQFSTDEVYGPDAENGTGHPEWDTIVPSNPYAASKAAQEAIAISYWRSYGVPVIITNTMNNFGEMQGPSKFPAMIQKKVAAGEVVNIHSTPDGKIGTRFYIHSRAAMDAILFILQNLPATLHTPGEMDQPDRYNVVGDIQLDNLEMAKHVADLMGQELQYTLQSFHINNPGHDLHYGLDGSKLASLGWFAPTQFSEAMAGTIKWQSEHTEWMRS